jgi:hypothetical protein
MYVRYVHTWYALRTQVHLSLRPALVAPTLPLTVQGRGKIASVVSHYTQRNCRIATTTEAGITFCYRPIRLLGHRAHPVAAQTASSCAPSRLPALLMGTVIASSVRCSAAIARQQQPVARSPVARSPWPVTRNPEPAAAACRSSLGRHCFRRIADANRRWGFCRRASYIDTYIHTYLGHDNMIQYCEYYPNCSMHVCM